MDNTAVAERIAVVPTNGSVPVVGALTRHVDCPPDLFGAGRYVVLRPMKIKMQREIRRMDLEDDEDVGKFQEVVARHVHEWNLADPWTGQDFTEISGDALDELTAEQWTWLIQELSSPNRSGSVPNT